MRISSWSLALATVGAGLLIGWGSGVKAAPVAPPPLCHCRAAVLMDATNGQVLYHWHAYRQMDPASITKIMTAYLVIRQGQLHRVVTISPQAASTPGSRMHLKAGQRYTILDLLRGLLLRSGNDAAVALAQAEAGSVSAFVHRMNQTARQLGAFNTHFVNPNGLTAAGHYSSAYDLALIARAALKLALFQHFVSTEADQVQELRSHQTRVLRNTNRLLDVFPPADGIKTGTTNAAGRCLAASATVHHVQLIAIVLHSQDRWVDARHLLTWGFAHWKLATALTKGQPLATVSVSHGTVDRVYLVAAHTVHIMVPTAESPTVIVTAPGKVMAPVRSGQVLGTAYVMANNQLIQAEPLHAVASVSRVSLPRNIWQQFWQWLQR